MDPSTLELRIAKPADRESVNEVVRAAVAQWELPARVKRLAMNSYLYSEADFGVLEFLVAEAHGELVGVAALEPAPPQEVPGDHRALLLHGLYVHPSWQRQGIGRELLAAVEALARERDYTGMLVRAQAGAGEFFRARGMEKLPAKGRHQYANRYWKDL